MDIANILNKYRVLCGAFCLSSCDSKCCKVGKLHFTRDLPIFVNKLVKSDTGFYELSLPCPLLKEVSCSSYAERPEICKDFPLFQRGKTVLISSFCPATIHMTDLFEELNTLDIKYTII